jgi:hypothetical protein
MDWQIIACLAISAGAAVAYFAMGDAPKSRPQTERKIQGNYAWKPSPAPQVDAEVIDRFVNALKAQSRPPV